MPTDIHLFNPFVRGFNDLRIQRLLAVLYDPRAPLCYLPPHPSQQHLSDQQLERQPCLFNDTDALIVIATDTWPLHAEDHPDPGIVIQVVYAMVTHDQTPPILVGDLYSEALAQKRIRELAFETGHYSRCWEISSAHLPDAVYEALVPATLPAGLLLEAFGLPDSHAIGFKLIATPWTDSHLHLIEGGTAEQLYQQQLQAGLPAELVNVLHLAAQADVRILIFDPDAARLEDLPTYDTLH